MRIPDDVARTTNAFLAFRATLIEGEPQCIYKKICTKICVVSKHNKAVLTEGKQGERIKSILCPGLGTAVGAMPFMVCAYQMLKAYQHVVLGRVFPHGQLYGCKVEHWDMIRERFSAEDRLAEKQKKKHLKELERLAKEAKREEKKQKKKKKKPVKIETTKKEEDKDSEEDDSNREILG